MRKAISIATRSVMPFISSSIRLADGSMWRGQVPSPFVGEAARATYEQDKVRRDGAPLLSTKSSFGDTACWVSVVFDHHLTTTVQWHHKMPEKPVVTTNNGLFRRFAVAVQNQQNLRSNASLYRPVVVLRPGRPEVRILPVALKKRIAMYFCNALFVLMLFGFRIILAAYHLPHPCIDLLQGVHFAVGLRLFS